MAGVNLSLYLSRSDLKVLHIVPGTNDVANGMVVVAKLLAKERGDAEVVDLNDVDRGKIAAADEVWVHGMWLPREWAACRMALRAGKRLVRMTHGSLSPIYLKCQSPFKKRLVGPIERFLLRRSAKIVATCEAEKEWIENYLGKCSPPIEVTDIKRFFNLSHVEHVDRVESGELHLLYLGRRHPLKGVECLEEAVAELNSNPVNPVNPVQNSSLHVSTCSTRLKIVSSAFGEELEKVWDWCDVLVLPTLSENFGLVIAEALERGKRVIATDGAPAWGDGNDYGGRLIYLKGYRDGTKDERVGLLRDALKEVLARVSSQGGK